MRGRNIVTIGGGTGSFMLLSGLKKHNVKLSAIVTMADDGGSSGVLRDELGVLPPGDVRQCLVALSESPLYLRTLFNYRFEKGKLTGHSFGNLFLSALEKTTGNFENAISQSIQILNVRGEVIRVTTQNAHLYLRLKNGKLLRGQSEIDNSCFLPHDIQRFFYKPNVRANARALRKIRDDASGE